MKVSEILACAMAVSVQLISAFPGNELEDRQEYGSVPGLLNTVKALGIRRPNGVNNGNKDAAFGNGANVGSALAAHRADPALAPDKRDIAAGDYPNADGYSLAARLADDDASSESAVEVRSVSQRKAAAQRANGALNSA
ncbi:hypothetical protein VFPPC_14933 [Pochonia chlamydosporia 170]|uniref:Uncharacterized protein n=1 Tax=Pochonia chlamydosporia 170 TaxID=1380566 RepID=A0A179FR57_METCM|nr:hypothetical protein VFPPC_14933 [Pochonia chlamydosporia 170]OAQ67573.1 hypothetical protein VFPPC_14933 [Pochonia chlamydosporia 170]